MLIPIFFTADQLDYLSLQYGNFKIWPWISNAKDRDGQRIFA